MSFRRNLRLPSSNTTPDASHTRKGPVSTGPTPHTTTNHTTLPQAGAKEYAFKGTGKQSLRADGAFVDDLTMGIVYTPQPIVGFMVRSVDEILQQ